MIIVILQTYLFNCEDSIVHLYHFRKYKSISKFDIKFKQIVNWVAIVSKETRNIKTKPLLAVFIEDLFKTVIDKTQEKPKILKTINYNKKFIPPNTYVDATFFLT